MNDSELEKEYELKTMSYAKQIWDNKVKMFLGKSEIDFDLPNLSETILLFLCEQFEKLEYVPNLSIGFDNNLKSLGNISMNSDDTDDMIYIIINPLLIKEETPENKNEIDELFKVLLHEFGHLIDLLKGFKNYQHIFSAVQEYYDNEWMPKNITQKEILEKTYKNEYIHDICRDNEIFAERFMLKHLTYFKTIYNNCDNSYFSAFYLD
jgi:hypothetical protein